MPEQYYSPTAESSSLADDNERKVDIRDVDVTPHSFEDIMSEHTLPYDSEQVQARAYATPQVSPILPLSACPSPVRGQSGDDYLSARLAALHEEYPDAIVVLRNADKLGATPLMEQGDRYIISGADLCKIDIDESFPNVEPDVFCGECWTRYIDSEMLGESKEDTDSSIQYISCSGEKLFSEMFAWCDVSDIVIADALPDMNNKSYDNYILSPRSLWEMEKGSYAADERADIRGESETDSSQATRDDIYFIKMYDSSTSFGSVITLATFDDDALAVSQLTGLPVDEHGMLEINSSRNEEEYAALLEAGIINKSVESSNDDTYRSYIVNAYNREISRFDHYQSYTLAAADTISHDADKDLANSDQLSPTPLDPRIVSPAIDLHSQLFTAVIDGAAVSVPLSDNLLSAVSTGTLHPNVLANAVLDRLDAASAAQQQLSTTYDNNMSAERATAHARGLV